MDNRLVCRPYRMEGRFALGMLACCPIFGISLGYFWADIEQRILFFLLMLLSLKTTKQLFDVRNTVIVLDRNEVQIAGNREDSYRCFTWEGFCYAYYQRTWKGHLFLLLSDEELDSKQVKHFIYGAANSARVCFEDKLAFPIEWIEERHALKQLVNEKVMIIHE